MGFKWLFMPGDCLVWTTSILREGFHTLSLDYSIHSFLVKLPTTNFHKPPYFSKIFTNTHFQPCPQINPKGSFSCNSTYCKTYPIYIPTQSFTSSKTNLFSLNFTSDLVYQLNVLSVMFLYWRNGSEVLERAPVYLCDLEL